MGEFTASNGVRVRTESRITGGRRLIFDRGEVAGVVEMTGMQMKALIETLDAERDKELGRWRWPENPDYVVYPKGDGWIVMSERSANSKHYSHREHAQVGSSTLTLAMRAYFEAHPERKPWEDAKEGDVWFLEINGEEEALLFRHDRTFISRDGDEFAPEEACITAGRRIWPEPADG